MTYVPGTEEKDTAKIIMSLQQLAINSGVSSFNARAGAVVPVQGDYPTSLIPGTTTNNSATAGNIGEYIITEVGSGAAVSLSTGVAADIATLSLTAGDWEVSGNVVYVPAATTSYTLAYHSISATSATQDGGTANGFHLHRRAAFVPVAFFSIGNVGPVRKSLSGTTTVYLVAQATFTVSTMAAYGCIRARRVR